MARILTGNFPARCGADTLGTILAGRVLASGTQVTKASPPPPYPHSRPGGKA